MDTWERIQRGLGIFRSRGVAELRSYVTALRHEDRLAADILGVCVDELAQRPVQALQRGTRLLPKVTREPTLANFLLLVLARAHLSMGEVSIAQKYFVRAMEFAEQADSRSLISDTRLNLFALMFMRAEYEQLYAELRDFMAGAEAVYVPAVIYNMCLLEIIRGKPQKALELARTVITNHEDSRVISIMEAQGLALRSLGRYEEAFASFADSARGYARGNIAYAAFPCAKAMELLALTDLKQRLAPDLLRKCVKLGTRGTRASRAAAREIEALRSPPNAGSAPELLDIARDYYSSHQNIEALFSGALAAHMAYRTESPAFFPAARLVAHLIPLHPGFKNDPLLGKFADRLFSLVSAQENTGTDSKVKAWLLGKLRVKVDDADLPVWKWGRRKALLALVYLLLSPRHTIADDHLFYLLWPRARYRPKTKKMLYTVISVVRRNLGDPGLLTRRHDFYQLEDTWTDLGELENLVRLADASQDPHQKEEYLARARELARGDLLPEFPYDRHIDEYRQYYRRLKKSIFGK